MGCNLCASKALSVTKLALGTAQFGMQYGIANKSGQIEMEEVNRIVAYARSMGIDTIDTAITYGQSETVLGRCELQDFRLITKLPKLPENQEDAFEWTLVEINNSLSRLNAQSLYGVLLHNPSDLLGPKGRDLVEALENIKKNGLVQKVGASIYNTLELDGITRVLDIELLQAPLNILDRRLETSGWLKTLCKNGVEVHTRSAFLQGLLLLDRKEIPTKFERWGHIWDWWETMCTKDGIRRAQACLEYPLQLPEVNRVIVGIDCLLQLKELVSATISPLQRPIPYPPFDVDDQLITPSNWNQL